MNSFSIAWNANEIFALNPFNLFIKLIYKIKIDSVLPPDI